MLENMIQEAWRILWKPSMFFQNSLKDSFEHSRCRRVLSAFRLALRLEARPFWELARLSSLTQRQRRPCNLPSRLFPLSLTHLDHDLISSILYVSLNTNPHHADWLLLQFPSLLLLLSCSPLDPATFRCPPALLHLRDCHHRQRSAPASHARRPISH